MNRERRLAGSAFFVSHNHNHDHHHMSRDVVLPWQAPMLLGGNRPQSGF
jgi:hypothetical protein